jgi:exodeoxyribonuclease VII small subunit
MNMSEEGEAVEKEGATMSSAGQESDETISYSEHLARLESIVRELESGQADLESTLALFEEGMLHLQACGEALDSAEGRLNELNVNSMPE